MEGKAEGGTTDADAQSYASELMKKAGNELQKCVITVLIQKLYWIIERRSTYEKRKES